jgi:hypothetical protein
LDAWRRRARWHERFAPLPAAGPGVQAAFFRFDRAEQWVIRGVARTRTQLVVRDRWLRPTTTTDLEPGEFTVTLAYGDDDRKCGNETPGLREARAARARACGEQDLDPGDAEAGWITIASADQLTLSVERRDP